MGYNQYRELKRPVAAPPAPAPVSKAGDRKKLVESIIAFAQDEAKHVWTGLGLDGATIPRVRITDLEGLKWGYTQFNTRTGNPKRIDLDIDYITQWTKVEYAQVFIFEMGNVTKAPSHHKVLQDMLTENQKNPQAVTKEAYVRAIEKIEWDFLEKLLAYVDAPDSPFKGHPVWTARPADFDDYFDNYAGPHKLVYEQEWDDYNQ